MHDLLGIEVPFFADSADLVGEGDLEGVEGVVGIFDHHRQGGRGDLQRGVDAVVKRGDDAGGGGVVRADDGFRRVEKIVDGGAFAQEFGMDGESEPFAGGFAAFALEDGEAESSAIPGGWCCGG